VPQIVEPDPRHLSGFDELLVLSDEAIDMGLRR
jgi:hypothetical protein